ncbi:MAG TPA: tetratricopeptide repeat protein [Isosphaeraceae bacterium]|jgi:tetratricopeptide (TPR) repeat protein|nr:tetratricopeptide repeat protein [Isosphaeraceae bacterium]
MSATFDRALVLYHQNRYDLAGRELRMELAQDPDNGLAHAVLALCLVQGKALDEAQREAEEAIRLAPTLPFSHYALATILYERHKLKPAEAAIAQAIQLDPGDADLFSLLAAIRFNRRRWADALEAAEQGLMLEPEHVDCNNLRAMALIKLGRKQEAGATIQTALARDPENAITHANQGWALLEQSNQRGALEHFRESLRLDPQNEWARLGIVEALKARHLIYRVMLRYFLWMAKLSGKAQWAVLLALVFGQSVLKQVGEQNPKLAPMIGPVLFLVFAFLVLTWIADPLFNLLLRLNRFGRLTLSREQIVASNWLGGFLLAALASLVASIALAAFAPRPAVRLLMVALELGLLVLPVSATFKCQAGWPRWVMAAFTLGLTLCGPGVDLLRLFVTDGALLEHLKAYNANFFTGVILSTWLAVILGSVRVER